MRSRATTSIAATPPETMASVNCSRLAKGASRPPQSPESGSIGEIVDGRGACRRNIEDPGVGHAILQTEPGDALPASLAMTASPPAAGSITHGMSFVEGNDAVEILAEPVKNLLETRRAILGLRAQRGIGGEEKCRTPWQPARRASTGRAI